ncbi:mCG140199, isoform CRA_b [Mus musculus]|nr:mCG140199, isoform CRA_b [Mus musculus]
MTGAHYQAWLLQKGGFQRGVGTQTLPHCTHPTYPMLTRAPALASGPRGQGWGPKTNLIDDCLRK